MKVEFTIAVATLVSSIMDAMIRRSGKGRQKTVRQVCIEIQTAILEYVRDHDALRILGPKGSSDAVLAYLGRIGMDPSRLLETFDG